MLNKIIPKIKKILKKNKIKKAGIFGSYARGEQKENSDVDILIQPTKGMSLLDISGLKIELKTALGKKVDIVSYNYIHPFLKKKILESEVKII
ncbi:nucleotidyltransferase domain-containing protein [Candidatus Pacearchaeota archaeon]|nr:nucleotidyltransferase domain-containing protein [Candidatus Pacearchaeota archaeon]